MGLSHLLRRSPLFAELKDEDLQRLESSLIRRRYPKGQVIFHRGDEGGSLYILQKGRVKVVIPSPRGEEMILAILSEGEIMGELSLIDGKRRSATVETLEETEVLCLRREDFLELLRMSFDAAIKVMQVLAQRLRSADALLAETHFLDVSSRVARKLLELGRAFGHVTEEGIRIGVKVTQKDLASMVGATRESVNKQLKWFRTQGLVRSEGGYFVLCDPVRLARRGRLGSGEEI